MIDKAVIEITVNTDKNDLHLKIINPPEFNEDTIEEFAQNHPAHAVAHTIILKIKTGT